MSLWNWAQPWALKDLCPTIIIQKPKIINTRRVSKHFKITSTSLLGVHSQHQKYFPNLRDLFVKHLYFSSQIYHTITLFMTSFFANVLVQILKAVQFSPTLKFSQSRNIPRHCDRECKTITNKSLPKPTVWTT